MTCANCDECPCLACGDERRWAEETYRYLPYPLNVRVNCLTFEDYALEAWERMTWGGVRFGLVPHTGRSWVRPSTTYRLHGIYDWRSLPATVDAVFRTR